MLEGKVVAITGAGSGIGQALAVHCAVGGARLALSGRNDLDETLAMLPKETDVRSYVVDVSSREAVFDYADDVRRDFGAAHYIFNNAGTSILATFQHITIEEIEFVLAVNLWGVIYGSKAFLPIMVQQGEGTIVNISSVFGLLATPCSVAYTISKFGVRALTETLWQELEGTGVQAILVHPGGIHTNIAKNSPHAKAEGDFERLMSDLNLTQMITPASDCARDIIAGIEAGKKRILVGSGAEDLFMLSRAEPDEYGSIMRQKLGL